MYKLFNDDSIKLMNNWVKMNEERERERERE